MNKYCYLKLIVWRKISKTNVNLMNDQVDDGILNVSFQIHDPNIYLSPYVVVLCYVLCAMCYVLCAMLLCYLHTWLMQGVNLISSGCWTYYSVIALIFSLRSSSTLPSQDSPNDKISLSLCWCHLTILQ